MIIWLTKNKSSKRLKTAAFEFIVVFARVIC